MHRTQHKIGKVKAKSPSIKQYSPLVVRMCFWDDMKNRIDGMAIVTTVKIGLHDRSFTKVLYIDYRRSLRDTIYASPSLIDGILANHMFLGLSKAQLKRYVRKGVISK